MLVAALVSTHLQFLSPQVFTSGLVSKSNSNLDRKAMHLYKIKKADYDYLYGIVRFCDRLSFTQTGADKGRGASEEKIKHPLESNAIKMMNL